MPRQAPIPSLPPAGREDFFEDTLIRGIPNKQFSVLQTGSNEVRVGVGPNNRYPGDFLVLTSI